MQLKASKIAEIIGVSNINESADTTEITNLLTDSRDLLFPESTIFFALKTPGNDGHNFIRTLYDRGVRYFVVDHEIPGVENMPDAKIFMTDDSLDALQEIATYVRGLIKVPVIAITGSRGKTIIKEQLAAMLSAKGYDVARSPRSYNSQIGVPLSLWEVFPHSDVVIIEAGISLPDEMSRLEKIIRPDIGIFSSLTSEHSEGFESLEQKAAQKAELFRSCDKVFIGANDHGYMMDCMIKSINHQADITLVHGDNMQISKTVSDLFPQKTDSITSCFIPEFVSPRIIVTQTLKNCLIVHDAFTFDARSIIDALNFTARLMTTGRNLSLILPYLPATPEVIQCLKARNVSRIITTDQPIDIEIEGIKSEFRDYKKPDVTQYTISDFSNEVILLKGAPDDNVIEEIKYTLEAPRHETVMEVDLGAITRNFNFFRSKVRPSTGIVAMVKANAYGTGALQIAKTLQQQGAAYLAVAVIDEGVELRQAGITMPIIVMNPIGTNYKALFDYKIEPSIFSLREFSLMIENARRYGYDNYPIHIKLDTGMHRLGFIEEELTQLIAMLNGQTHLKAASIFSHLATADCLDQDEYTISQLRAFDTMSSEIIESLPYRVKRHLLNTAGIIRFPEYQYDMVRLGIGLYGVSPIPGAKMEPVAKVATTIISIKDWGPDTTIGYGRKGRVHTPSRIATIPIGYADGLNRHLSNGAASLLVNGKMCPIIGNICMDQCMIDVTGADAKIGDTVEIFGKNAPIERLSDALQTIPYEVLTSVSQRVKRIYFRE